MSTIDGLVNTSQTRYWLRLCRTATQSVSNNSSVYVSWDTIETTGRGSNNWNFTPATSGATKVTIPVSGMYLIIYEGVWSVNSVGTREHWIEINSSSIGNVRRWAETTEGAAGGSPAYDSSFMYYFNANDNVQMAIYQNSGSTLNFSGQNTNSISLATLQLYRLSE